MGTLVDNVEAFWNKNGYKNFSLEFEEGLGHNTSKGCFDRANYFIGEIIKKQEAAKLWFKEIDNYAT